MTRPGAAVHAIRGHLIWFADDPFIAGPHALRDEADGVVLIEDGRITARGPAGPILAGLKQSGQAEPPIAHYPGQLIMAGFVDAHVHYPQTGIIASYGAQLLDWLRDYTFPAEAAFADPAHAAAVAEFFLDELLRNGTTSAGVYCTVHPQSVDAFFTAALARNLRMAAGKVMMDRNGPDRVLDTADLSYRDSEALIGRWDGRRRLRYAITPRFAPTSSEAQLEAAGALWRAYPRALMQTHLSENRAELAWVAQLFPHARDYLDVYERFGLLGPGAIFGHAIHLNERERAKLAESNAAIAHCPTSNLFMGSGLFDMGGMRAGPHPASVALATDVGGGSSFSMFATMRAAYEIAQLQGFSLHPACAFWLATIGGARALRMEDKVGNLAPGMEADLVVIDPASRPLLAERTRHARDIFDLLFAQMILADDRAISAVYVDGELRQGQGAALDPPGS